MHRRSEIPAELSRLAGLQGDVLTREQAIGFGVTDRPLGRLVASGRWQRLARGVYYLQSGPPPWLAWAWAGVLVGGDAARLAGLAAAHLHAIAEAPDQLDVLVPLSRGLPLTTGPWSFRREGPGVRGRRSVGMPPRLGLEDTVLDLVAVCTDPSEVVGWVTSAVQTRRTSPARLRRALASRRLQRHRRLLEDLLLDVAAGAVTPLELGYLRKVERPHQLPVGRRQRRRRRTEVDVWYEEYGLLVELDGRLGHEGMGRFRDMHRDNASTSDGLATLRYGHADVHGSSCQVARQVAENLIRRGWDGSPTRCDSCRRVA